MAGRERRRGDLTRLADPEAGVADGAEVEGGTPSRVRPWELPRLIARATNLAWRAAPRELARCGLLQAAGGIAVAIQLALGRTVIEAVVDDTGESLRDVLPSLLGLAAVTAVATASSAILVERQQVLAALVERHVQDRILDVVADVDLGSFESPAFHDRLRRATVNASERSWLVSQAIVALVAALVTLGALAIVLVRIEPLLLAGVLVAYVPVHLATTRNSRASYEFNYWMTTPDRERSYLWSVLLGRAAVKEVRLFGSAAWLRDRYDRLYDLRIEEFKALTRRRLRRSLIAHGGMIVLTALGVSVLISWALSGRITAAEAGIAAVALQQLGLRLRTVGGNAGTLHESSLFLADVTTFLEMPTERSVAATPVEVPERFEHLAVDGVSFTYPGTDAEVLRDVSLEIRAGEVVALVGANGSGKTTLAKLLCGFYGPDRGRILWDGHDVAAYDLHSLRRRIAAVFQDYVRFELSGKHNIGLGDTTRIEDDLAIHLAARAAGADDVLGGLPFGYDTRLSREYEDGVDLSIGEWQRVALARAFFRDAPFLVLDEPTASLDAHAEHELFDAMRDLQRGRAVLLISHRFSTVRSADRIYVLDRGRIIEAGTHTELMARRGRYAEMFTLQAAAYLGDEPDPVTP